jgi:hypothetical protein
VPKATRLGVEAERATPVERGLGTDGRGGSDSTWGRLGVRAEARTELGGRRGNGEEAVVTPAVVLPLLSGSGSRDT